MNAIDEDADRKKLQEDIARAAEEEEARAAKKGQEGAEEEGAEEEEEGAVKPEEVTGVEAEPLKVCVQMVNDQDTYNGIAQGTTIAIKNDDGTYTVSKKDGENSPAFSPGKTYQQLVESFGGKRRKTAKRGGKSSKGGRKSAKRSRKTAKKGRKGKGSRRSKK